MASDRIWTAAELEQLDERDRVIRAGFITDPASIPAAIVERAHRKADARIAATDSNQTKR